MPLRRDRFVTGPGPDAGGSKPGREGCHQTPEKSGMAAPWVAPLAAPAAGAVCPSAGVAAAAASVVNVANKRNSRCRMLMPTSRYRTARSRRGAGTAGFYTKAEQAHVQTEGRGRGLKCRSVADLSA